MLSQAHRRSIHASLTPILGEEEAEALMSEFPAHDADRPVGQAMFATAITDLRHDMAAGFAEMRTETRELLRQMAMAMMAVVAAALVGGMGLSAAIAAGVARAVGG